jgi:hypothetical protein
MSRQSKQAKRAVVAKAITALHKAGKRGPSRTSPKTEGRHGYRHNAKRMEALAEFVKGMRLAGKLGR